MTKLKRSEVFITRMDMLISELEKATSKKDIKRVVSEIHKTRKLIKANERGDKK